MKIEINIIVAVSKNNVIGQGNQLPWRIASDLKRFRRLTSYCPVIMGRKTWQSLPNLFLIERHNIVISSKMDQYQNETKAHVNFGPFFVNSLDDAIREASMFLSSQNNKIFLIGGSSIYTEALEKDLVDKIYITRIEKNYNGDTFFPHSYLSNFQCRYSENDTDIDRSDNSTINYNYRILTKV